MIARPTAFAARLRIVFGGLAAIVLLVLALAPPAHGAGPTATSNGSAANESAAVSDRSLTDLIQTIEDDEARQNLLDRLRTLQTAGRANTKETNEAKPGGFLNEIGGRVDTLGRQLMAAGGALFDVPKALAWLQDQLSDPEKRRLWAAILLKLLAVLVAGLAAEWLIKRLLASPLKAVEDRKTDKMTVRAALLAIRTFLDILPLIAFACAAYAALTLTETDAVTQGVALAAIQANILVRAITAIARMVLAPRVSALRLPPIEDETANYLFVWTRRFADVALYGYFTAVAARSLGVGEDGVAAIVKLVGLILVTMLIVFVLQNRSGVATAIRGGGRAAEARGRALGVLRARFADIWHILAIAYIAGTYIVAILETEEGVLFLMRATALTVVVLAIALGLGAMIRHATARGFALGDETRARFPNLEARANRYLPVLQAILRGIVFLLALLSLMEAWGIDAYGWLATDAGGRTLRSIATVLFVTFLAILVWEIASSAIENQLQRLEQFENNAGTARLATLLPLIRQTLFFILATVVVMIILAELGVNIGPLLAAAGVAGLAIGFGAQTLVKDVITGLFILLENQIRVGDVVNLGGNAGVVEGMTIRTIRLRDLTGTVHIIPFSEVGKVLNLTKEFSYYLLEIGVAYREDTDQVVEVCKEILDEMRDDPHYGPSILEPLDVLGVDRFADSAVIVRARIKTLPIKQWEVGREFNRRMKKKFDELGIEIPFPHRTIYFGVDKEGKAPPAPVELTQPAKDG